MSSRTAAAQSPTARPAARSRRTGCPRSRRASYPTASSTSRRRSGGSSPKLSACCGAGGLAIADIVPEEQLKDSIVCDADLWASCIGGAAQTDAYHEAIEAAGLRIEFVKENPYEFISRRAREASAKDREERLAARTKGVIMAGNGRVIVGCSHGEEDPDAVVVSYLIAGAALDQGQGGRDVAHQ
jgi:hypothetical protein